MTDIVGYARAFTGDQDVADQSPTTDRSPARSTYPHTQAAIAPMRSVTQLVGVLSAVSLLLAFTSAPAQPAAANSRPAMLERGSYLVQTAAGCGLCHTTRGPKGEFMPGMNLAGGLVVEERGFRAIVPNITPDTETGIGDWSDAQIATAVRDGRRPDGSLIGPPMPTDAYRGISDRDLAAIVAYLRTVPPVHHATERSTYPTAIESQGPPVASV